MEQKDLEYYLSQVRRIADHREKDAMKEIRKAYKSLMQELQHFVADEYAQYAKDDKLTFAMLNQKRQYARFIEEATAVVDKWYPALAKKATSVVDEIYKLTYDGMVSAVKKSNTTKALNEALKGVKAATPQVVKRAIANPIGGLTLPDTLERNRQNIIYEIKQQLNIGLVNGDRYSTMAKRITERVDIDYRKAVRIVRTETHRVREAGFNDSATEINDTLKQGVTAQRLFKTWQTMEDERVRDTNRADHRKMNGVSVGMDEEFNLGNGVKTKVPGQSGSAANDCNCRCFVVYDLKEDEEVAKNLSAEKKAALEAAKKKLAGEQAEQKIGNIEKMQLSTKVSNIDKDAFKAWFDKAAGGNYKFDEIYNAHENDTIEELLKDLTKGKTEVGQKRVFDEFEKVAGKAGAPKDPYTDAYSQARKDAAWWAQSKQEADDNLREEAGRVWREAPEDEKKAIHRYTGGAYTDYNAPLSGYPDGWRGKSVGVGNCSINAMREGENIRRTTEIISRSSYDHDLWLQRGSGTEALDTFLGLAAGDVSSMTNEELQQFVGRSNRMYSFLSCGSSKGTGFDKPMMMNFYCPAGSKMMYIEPISIFGNGDGLNWDGISKQQYLGEELETLLQRGGSYTLTKIEKKNGTIFVDFELHPEHGYDLIQQFDDELGKSTIVKASEVLGKKATASTAASKTVSLSDFLGYVQESELDKVMQAIEDVTGNSKAVQEVYEFIDEDETTTLLDALGILKENGEITSEQFKKLKAKFK